MIRNMLIVAAITASPVVYASDFKESVTNHLNGNEIKYVDHATETEMKSGSVGGGVILIENGEVQNRLCIVESSGYTYCMGIADFYQLTGKK